MWTRGVQNWVPLIFANNEIFRKFQTLLVAPLCQTHCRQNADYMSACTLFLSLSLMFMWLSPQPLPRCRVSHLHISFISTVTFHINHTFQWLFCECILWTHTDGVVPESDFDWLLLAAGDSKFPLLLEKWHAVMRGRDVKGKTSVDNTSSSLWHCGPENTTGLKLHVSLTWFMRF